MNNSSERDRDAYDASRRDLEARVKEHLNEPAIKTALHARDKETLLSDITIGIGKNIGGNLYKTLPREGLTDPDHSINPRDYVLGFAFTTDRKEVVLIQKNRPLWQAGCLNGVGGKMEDDDATSVDAIEREWREETGTEITNWTRLATVKGVGWNMRVFQAFNDIVRQAYSTTDEEIRLFPVNYVLGNPEAYKLLPSLRFYIPLALDEGTGLVKPLMLEYNTVK